MMEKIIATIKSFYDDNNWKYIFKEEDHVFLSELSMGNVIGTIKIFIFIQQDHYTVYTVINSKVEEEHYPTVAEFLHRVNYGLNNGNFEIDYNDGEVRYKAFVNFEDSNISERVVEDSILVGPAMVNRYGKGLLKVMLGDKNIKACIKDFEKGDENKQASTI